MKGKMIGTALGILCMILGGTGAFGETGELQPSRSIVDQVLTFLDSAAIWMGEGILDLLNSRFQLDLAQDMARALGYLIIITMLLLLAIYVKYARTTILLALVAAWALLIARFVTAALR